MKRFIDIIVKICVVAIGLIGIYFLALWVNNITHRLFFPFPIEFLEDAIFFHALRIYEGQPLYIDPNDGFTAIIYTPGYFYLLATLFKIFGPTIVMGRVISLICTISIAGLLIAFSIKRLRFPLLIVPPVVYFSLMYAHFAGYQDLGRVDPLMVLIVLAGLFLIGDGKTGMKRVLAGTLIVTLACYVKQPALAYLPFVYLFIIIGNRKTGFIAMIVSVVLLLGIFLAANAATDCWFAFYTLKAPMAHPVIWNKAKIIIWGGFINYPIRGIRYLLLTFLIYLAFRILRKKREPLNIFEATLPGAAIAGIIPFLKVGGYFQDFLPLYTHLVFLLPFALFMKKSGNAESENVAAGKYHPAVAIILMWLLVHCAFSISPWNEFPPKPDNMRIGLDYVAKVREIDGEVLMPYLGYYAWLAGKEPGYVGVTMTDIACLDVQPEKLINDILSGRYAAIFLPEGLSAEFYWLGYLEKCYNSPRAKIIESPHGMYDLRRSIEYPPNTVYYRVNDNHEHGIQRLVKPDIQGWND